jgi:4-amino-4-deoxy-L-arabinose transferase-like glycosyltransferase
MNVAFAATTSRWSDWAAIALLLAIVSTLYGARLADAPAVGEETRWGSGAREMLETGDWIVPRQQGIPFPERPPMTMWLMALVGAVRGDVDVLAIRLPSVIAVVLTTLLIYGYTRVLVSGFAGFVAALAYASMGQVLQIGRMGESEAVFALLVSSSLLLWHLAYLRGWQPLAAWSIGFACAALAALVKGPQAPVYFGAITGVYLLVRRDWRYALNWQYAAGVAIFAAIIAAWQIPFYLATDLDAVMATWAGLATDRVHLSGLAIHFVTYPLETFACLLPWSPILFALVRRETRELLADQWPVVSFLVIACVVAYPTVWIVAGAQARYFMPLYPLVAVLLGIVIERCSLAALDRYPRRAWHQFLLVAALLAVVLGVVAVIPAKWALGSHQPFGLSVAIAMIGAAVVATIWFCYRAGTPIAKLAAVAAIASFAGIVQAGAMTNFNIARWNDPAPAVDQIKQIVASDQLVSLTPIDHRFAYLYKQPITELAWPTQVADLPANVEYFCFMRHPVDTAEKREAGRGRTWTTSPGTLPFAWEEVATLCVERRVRDYPQRMLVLGRVIQPRIAQVSDATRPQRSINLTAASRTPLTR